MRSLVAKSVIFLISIIGAILFLIGFGWPRMVNGPGSNQNENQPEKFTPLPSVVTSPGISGVVPTATPESIPDQNINEISRLPAQPTVDLSVPFMPQAPEANWSQPYQDACEEASVIMVEKYLTGQELTIEEMDQEILRLVDWQTDVFGSYQDTNTAETAQLIEEFYPHLDATVKYDVTATDIKNELHLGRVIIVLVNGQKIGNPFYNPPGPLKHALVIRGYNERGEFFTNDPGTKRGEKYVYSTAAVLNAMYDYDGIKSGTGKKAMIVVQTK